MDEVPKDDISFPVSFYPISKVMEWEAMAVLWKKLSIGFASTRGKTWIHSAGNTTDHKEFKNRTANQQDFTDSMADAASAIVKYFKENGGIVYINVVANISLKYDCAGLMLLHRK